MITYSKSAMMLLWKTLETQSEFYGIKTRTGKIYVSKTRDRHNIRFFTTQDAAWQCLNDLVERGTYRPSEVYIAQLSLMELHKLALNAVALKMENFTLTVASVVKGAILAEDCFFDSNQENN